MPPPVPIGAAGRKIRDLHDIYNGSIINLRIPKIRDFLTYSFTNSVHIFETGN